ncbi:hypothetical protein [Metalysinibacillus jejuensis]|uniref:hypothetical protein n=1 Tax=Metalysinibacillus jejuensis TaxID=914327 RepID=UPI000D3351D4|nr:hypothetical protein [Metalysinibacillus jejuensis]
MVEVLQNIDNYDKITSATNQVLINNVSYQVATSGENARTAETMQELTEVIQASVQAIGSKNEGQMIIKLQEAITDFVNVFEVVGIE